METISIALACTVIGAVISYATFQRNRRHDIRADTREEAQTRAKLDYIATAVDEIRLDNKARDREVTELKESTFSTFLISYNSLFKFCYFPITSFII